MKWHLTILPVVAALALTGCAGGSLESKVRSELAKATVASAQEDGIGVAGVRCAAKSSEEMQSELDGTEGISGDEVDDLMSKEDSEGNSIYIDCTIRDTDNRYHAQICFIRLEGGEESSCVTFDDAGIMAEILGDFATSSAYKGNGWQVFPAK